MCHRLLISGLSLLVLFGCKEQDPQLTAPESGGLLVICEGNFQSGNAELGLLDDQYRFTNNLFRNANGFPLGDVLQDAQMYNGHLYLVLNNSGKLEKLDASTFKVQSTGKGFNSPRKICFFDSERAFVTDLYADAFYEIRLSDLSIVQSISCSGWTESILKFEDKLLIVNIERGVLLEYSPLMNQFTDSVALPSNPGDLLLDKDDVLWLYCGGEAGQKSSLLKIEPQGLNLLQTFQTPEMKELFPKMTINTTKDTLFLLNSGIYAMPTQSILFPLTPLVDLKQSVLYGIGHNRLNGDLIISENPSFSEASKIHIFHPNGQSKAVGIEGGMVVSGFLNR